MIFSLVLFVTGLVTGWWLHLRWPPITVPKPVVMTPHMIVSDAVTPELPSHPSIPSIQPDLQEFRQLLEDERYDDALTLYQRYENEESPLSARLRDALFEQIKQWSNEKRYGLMIHTLQRFSDYYYQDIQILKLLAQTYAADRQLDNAIETYINARAYTYEKEVLSQLGERIHSLAKQWYEHQAKRQSLESLVRLFQKLAFLEPDYAFYRFVLAKSYIASGDNEGAIRELEMLQLDPDYGERAGRMLAELLPLPVPGDADEPANTIALSGSGGHYIVNTIAGGKYGVRLLIDTGATLTTFPVHILTELRKRELATRIAHVELKTANGIRMAPVYRLKEFQIGSYTLHNLEVAELDLGGDSDGLLGMNVLSKFHFFIDQNQQVLSLTPR